MKTSKFILLTFLSLALVFLSSCDEDPEGDPEEEVSAFIGDYIITEATLSENLVLQTIEIGPMTMVAGLDITEMIQTALLGAIDCEPENSLIEMREDFSLYLSCTSSMDELDAGTWEEQSDTEIVLNMNSTAIPASATGIVLTVSEITIVDDVLSGETTVPISEEMLAAIVGGMSGGQVHLDEEATPPALPITFIIELAKQ